MSQHFKDKNFQPQHAGKCDLLIQLSPARISYAIIDQVQDQLQLLFDTSLLRRNGRIEMLDKLDELINTKEELKYHFRKVKVSMQTSHFTFIPQELFDQSYVSEYAKFISSDSAEKENVQVRDIKGLGVKNIIALDNDLKNAIEDRFSGALLFSQADPFIAGISTMNTIEGILLALHIQSETIEFAVFDADKLVFYNLFDCYNADELNYFLLHILKELNLDVKQTKVVLAGAVEKNDDNYNRIQKYFDDIHFLNTRQLLVQSNLTDQLVHHYFFSLISLDLCD